MIRSATSGFDRLDLERLWRWLFAALAASFIALTATGIWLTYRYEPIVGLQFDNIRGGRDITQSAMQYVHRWGAYTFVGLAAALLLVTLFRFFRTARINVALAFGMLGGAIALVITGPRLVWDQLALWAVTVGTDMQGYTPIFRDDIKFVQLGSSEPVGIDTLRRWYIVHAIALPVVLIVVTASLAWLVRRRRRVLTS